MSPAQQVTTDPADQMRLFELLHGAWLATQNLDAVLASGRGGDEADPPDLFTKYPDLGAAAARAEEALNDLYQVAGCHLGDADAARARPPG